MMWLFFLLRFLWCNAVLLSDCPSHETHTVCTKKTPELKMPTFENKNKEWFDWECYIHIFHNICYIFSRLSNIVTFTAKKENFYYEMKTFLPKLESKKKVTLSLQISSVEFLMMNELEWWEWREWKVYFVAVIVRSFIDSSVHSFVLLRSKNLRYVFV